MKMGFTGKQGQYLAFTYYYIKVNGRSPGACDVQHYFRVTPLRFCNYAETGKCPFSAVLRYTAFRRQPRRLVFPAFTFSIGSQTDMKMPLRC